jgi:transposase InsO family protein
MDETDYNNLKTYLETSQTPQGLTLSELKTFKNQASHYILQHHKLYRRNRKTPQEPLRVIKHHELKDILFSLHEHPLAGHFGIEGTYNRSKNRYYWPGMYKSIAEYVKTCDDCQRQGGPQHQEPLHPLQVGQPFDRVGIDIVGPMKITRQGNRYIVVATEYLTKWVEARAIPDMKATTIAKFIYEEIICRHGCPKELLSDQGTSFCNELVRALCKIMGIKHKLASAYHPQTNGLTERFNRTLCTTLAKYAHEQPDKWDSFLSAALFAYRTLPQSTTKYEPFQLMYGRKAMFPIDIQKDTIFEHSWEDSFNHHIEHITTTLQQQREQAQQNIKESQEKQKERHDNNLHSLTFSIGDKVLLFESAKAKVHGDKIREKWRGPFYIHDKVAPGAYKLRNMNDQVLKRSVNAERLKRYFERPVWNDEVTIVEKEPPSRSKSNTKRYADVDELADLYGSD